jgi:predicted DNA binding CopG/RHH family protein
MAEYDDAAAQHYEDPENLTPAGPGRRVRTAGTRALDTHVPVRFSAELIAAVKRLADVDGMTVSTWIRTTVSREVERRRPRPTTEHSAGPTLEFQSPPRSTQTVALEPDRQLIA